MTTTYTLLGETPETQLTITELKQQLESTSETIKIQTMKRLLHQMLNGDSLDSILMHVIRFIMPSKNKILKKLLLLFWELVSKLDSNGILKQEMILMCSHLRNDLQHPNEFIRGVSLRFLCKLKQIELLEPCIPTIKVNLSHRHPFVRKNAVLALACVFQFQEHLVPGMLSNPFMRKINKSNTP